MHALFEFTFGFFQHSVRLFEHVSGWMSLIICVIVSAVCSRAHMGVAGCTFNSDFYRVFV